MNYSHLTVQPGRPGAPNSQHNQAPPVSAGNLLPQQQQQASKGVSNPQNHSMVHANLPLLGPNISLNAKIADDKAPQLGNNNLGGFQQQISHAQQLPIRNPNLPTMLHPMQQQTNKQMAQSHQSMQKPQIAPNPIPHQPPVYQIQVPVMHQQSLMHKSPAYPPLSSLPLKGNNYGPPTQAPQSHLLQTPPKSHPQLKTTMKVGSPSSLAMGSTQKLATIPPVSSQYLGQPNKNLVPSSIPATGPQPSLSAYQPLSQPQMTYSVNKPVTKAPAPQNFSASKAPVTSSPAKVAPLTITCKAGQPAVSTFGTTPVVPQLVKATTVQGNFSMF